MQNDTLWYTRCPVPTAFSIAIELGWLDAEFRPDGLEVNSLLNSRVRATRESPFAHTQANSFRHGGNIPPLWAFSEGRDVRLIGLSWNDENQLVLTRPDSGIRSAADLRGRKLAVPRRLNDSIDFWRATVLRGYASALQIAGLSARDVDLVEIPIARTRLDDAPEEAAQTESLWGAASTSAFQREEAVALLTGQVDAIFSPHAHAAEIKAFLGAYTVLDLGKHPDRRFRMNNGTPLAFTASGALINERPDLVARLLARVLQAAEWAKIYREKTFRIVAAESGVPEEIAIRAFGGALPDQLTIDLSGEKIAAVNSQKQFLLEQGFIKRDFDIDQFIDPSPLRQASELLRDRNAGLPRRDRERSHLNLGAGAVNR